MKVKEQREIFSNVGRIKSTRMSTGACSNEGDRRIFKLDEVQVTALAAGGVTRLQPGAALQHR